MGRPRKVLRPSPDMSSFGIWLVVQMNKSNITILDIVNNVGISYSVIYAWIRGDTTPRILNLIEVCEMLSRKTNTLPYNLMSDAIFTFPEAIYAHQRYIKRNPSTTTDDPTTQDCVIESKKGVTYTDHNIFSCDPDKNCNKVE